MKTWTVYYNPNTGVLNTRQGCQCDQSVPHTANVPKTLMVATCVAAETASKARKAAFNEYKRYLRDCLNRNERPHRII